MYASVGDEKKARKLENQIVQQLKANGIKFGQAPQVNEEVSKKRKELGASINDLKNGKPKEFIQSVMSTINQTSKGEKYITSNNFKKNQNILSNDTLLNGFDVHELQVLMNALKRKSKDAKKVSDQDKNKAKVFRKLYKQLFKKSKSIQQEKIKKLKADKAAAKQKKQAADSSRATNDLRRYGLDPNKKYTPKQIAQAKAKYEKERVDGRNVTTSKGDFKISGLNIYMSKNLGLDQKVRKEIGNALIAFIKNNTKLKLSEQTTLSESYDRMLVLSGILN